MSIVCAVALVLTTAAGVLSDTLAGRPHAISAGEAAADAQARAEMIAMGWQVPESGSLRSLGEQLRASHGVELLHVRGGFRLELESRTITGQAATEAALAAASVLVADELTLYPEGFMRASGLRRVALCSDLQENRRAIPSLPNYRNTLLLDVDGSSAFLRRLLHHEVFHFADLADDADVLSDPAWAKLNPAGFAYGHGGRDMRQPAASALTDGLPGFLTRYATSALEEDKAEVFAFLMVQPSEVARRARSDAVLAAKARRIRAIAQALDPAMDAAFWARVGRMRAR
jgi:hypothetical protein